jgi:hypothetical protein
VPVRQHRAPFSTTMTKRPPPAPPLPLQIDWEHLELSCAEAAAHAQLAGRQAQELAPQSANAANASAKLAKVAHAAWTQACTAAQSINAAVDASKAHHAALFQARQSYNRHLRVGTTRHGTATDVDGVASSSSPPSDSSLQSTPATKVKKMRAMPEASPPRLTRTTTEVNVAASTSVCALDDHNAKSPRQRQTAAEALTGEQCDDKSGVKFKGFLKLIKGGKSVEQCFKLFHLSVILS